MENNVWAAAAIWLCVHENVSLMFIFRVAEQWGNKHQRIMTVKHIRNSLRHSFISDATKRIHKLRQIADFRLDGPHCGTDNCSECTLNVISNTVYPKKYAHGFVVLCFVVVMQSFIMNSHEVFIHIHQGCSQGWYCKAWWIWVNQSMYNHNKAQQSKNRVHISWDILYVISTIRVDLNLNVI